MLSEYNRTDIAGKSLRKIQSGSDSYFYASLLPIERDINQIPFSVASLKCLQPLDEVSGLYFEE